MRMISHSPDETLAIGASFAEKAVPGQILALKGDLGAGKTVFAKGFAKARDRRRRQQPDLYDPAGL